MRNARHVLFALALAATATAQEAPTVDELRAALKDPAKRDDTLDEIARYWEGRDELEPDVRALVATDWRAAWALGMKRNLSGESIDALAQHVDHLAAQWALAQAGERAIPAIIQGLNDAARQGSMCGVLEHMGAAGRDAGPWIIPLAIDGDQAAREALGAMAPLGAPLLRALVDAAATNDVELLCLVGPPAFSRLHKLWKADEEARYKIARFLGGYLYAVEFFLTAEGESSQANNALFRIGPRSVPRLVQALPNPRAIDVLGSMGAPDRLVETALIEHLNDERYEQIAEALSEIGVKQSTSATALTTMLRKHPDGHLEAYYVIEALKNGDSEAGQLALASLLTDELLDIGKHQNVLDHLVRRSPDLVKARLAALLEESPERSVYADALALGWNHELADPERFRKRLPRIDDAIDDLLVFLRMHELEHEAFVDAARTWSKDLRLDVRADAIAALIRWKSCPEPDRRWLFETARDTDHNAQDYAIMAIATLPPDDTEALESLLSLARTDEDSWAWHALEDRPGPFRAEILKKYPEVAVGIVGERGVRSDAELKALLRGFSKLEMPAGPDPFRGFALFKPIVAVPLLDDRRPLVRVRAAHSLGKDGDTDHIPVLRRRLLDTDIRLRIAAWDAIADINARAAMARPR
ncbi:MAG: HEAT repeat domain-containing protein [Planctomycetota bacterium]